MYSEEHLYSIALKNCNLIGDLNFKKLTDAFGSAERIWKLSPRELQALFGIGKKITAEIGNPKHLKFAENEINYCANVGIKIKLRHLGDLPPLLDECPDAPAVLYQKGDYKEDRKTLSMVGTRNMSFYGKTFIDDFLEEVKSCGLQTVSGLALGVDAEVHRSSIHKRIPTIGVLAHGFQFFYPSKNQSLSEKILEEGGTLFTEFSSSKKPERQYFIQRNRVIAGLSASTIVVETAYGGGSISTVSFANDYNREVYALPGKITDATSQGCNLIIAQNKAIPIVNIKTLVKDLKLDVQEKQPELFPASGDISPLSGTPLLLYETIRKYPNISLDELAVETSMPTFQILPFLLDLEISGHIRMFSGRQFKIV